MQEETWKDIPYFDGSYQVSSLGRIKSTRRYVLNNGFKSLIRERILKQQKNRKNYNVVSLSFNRKKSTMIVHRLVAICFIENPSNKSQVNHIDFDKDNNKIYNLEWNTNRENAHHFRSQKKSTSKYVGVHYSKKNKKWTAQISIIGKTYSLGVSNDEDEAHKLYKRALNNWIKNKTKPNND